MAGKRSRRNDGARRSGGNAGSERARKPTVAPIIDLEATEVIGEGVETAKDAPRATPFEQDVPEGTSSEESATEPAAAGAGARAKRRGWRLWLTPRAWSVVLRRLFTLRIRNPRWIRIAGAGLIAVFVFAGGIWIGWNVNGVGITDETQIVATPENAGQLAQIEMQLQALGELTGKLDARLEALEGGLGTLATQVAEVEQAATGVEEELSDMRAAFDALLLAPPVSEDGEAIGALQLQLNSLAGKLDALEDAIAGLGGSGPNPVLEEKLAGLETNLAETNAALQRLLEESTNRDATDFGALVSELEQALQAQLADMETRLEERLSSLETSGPEAPGAASDITVAVASLQLAVDEGRPFASELGQVVALAPQYPELSRLSAHAQSGIATAAELDERFAVLAHEVQEALSQTPAMEEPADGWIADMWERLRDMVQIRRGDEPDNAAMLRFLDTARAHAAAGDFAATIEALRGIRGVADAPVGAWMTATEAHLDVNDAIAAIVARMLADVAGGSERSGS